MWVVAGVLLGLVVLASLVGVHTGPHAHVLAAVVGAIAAFWLVLMLFEGRSAPALWVLLGADLVLVSGVGITAWKGITGRRAIWHHLAPLESMDGVAVSDLVPDGIVRIRGEQWSATSVNGTVRTGTRVQVLRAEGVRLEVWGEDAEARTTDGLFSLDPGVGMERGT